MAPGKLSRERIIEASIALLESGGEPLTMRGLARRLEVDPMAVYRHFSDKADLMGALADTALSELSPLDPNGEWEPQLRRLVKELRTTLVDRPALVPVILEAPATPGMVALAGDAIGLLANAGLTDRNATAATGAVFAYAIGAVAIEVANVPPVDDEEALRADALRLIGDGVPLARIDAALDLLQADAFAAEGLDILISGVADKASKQ